MIKYKTGGWGKSPIEAVAIDRETAKCVWIKGSMLHKISNYHVIHDSWLAAKEHLLLRAKRSVAGYERNLESAKKALAEIESLADLDHGAD